MNAQISCVVNLSACQITQIQGEIRDEQVINGVLRHELNTTLAGVEDDIRMISVQPMICQWILWASLTLSNSTAESNNLSIFYLKTPSPYCRCISKRLIEY